MLARNADDRAIAASSPSFRSGHPHWGCGFRPGTRQSPFNVGVKTHSIDATREGSAPSISNSHATVSMPPLSGVARSAFFGATEPRILPLISRGGLGVARTRKKKNTPPGVLIAEDEPTVRTLAESIIADLGYTTLSAANARERS